MNPVPAVPQDEAAERAIIGSVLLLPELFDELAARLSAADFFYLSSRAVWEALAALNARGDAIDELSLRLELSARGVQGNPNDDAWLFSARNLGADSPAAAQQYAGRVREYAARRSVLTAASTLTTQAANLAVNLDTALAQHAHALEAIPGMNHASATLSRIYGPVFDQYGKPDTATRLPTGLANLDTQLGDGLKRRKLLIPASRPGVGKTALMLYMAYAMVSAGRQVGFVSLEMDDEELSDRLTSLDTGLAQSRLRSVLDASSEAALERTFTKFTVTTFGHSLHLVYDGGMTMERLRALIATWARQGVQAMFVDYIQLLESGGLFRHSDRVAEVSYFSRNLKRLAMTYNIAVIAASQLSREIEKRADKTPILSDLRESGSLEQDADIVALLNRPGLYDELTDKRVLHIDIAKQRAGEPGLIKAWFNPVTGRIMPPAGENR